MNARKLLITAIVLTAIFNLQSSICHADDFVPAVDTVPSNASTSYTLDSGDSGGDIILQFGTALAEFLKWNSVSTRFDLSDDLNLTGGLTTSGGANSFNNNSNFTTDINTGTSTGAVSIGGGVNTVAVNSSVWDISAAGVASGFTGLASANGTISLNDNSGTSTTSIGGGTTTGAVTIGGTGTQTLDIGNGAGVKTVNVGSSNTTSTTSLLSGSGGLNFNVNNNQPTNLNTGTSTGAVSIGGNANTIAIDGTNFDLTTTGAVTLTGHMTLSPDVNEGLSGGGLVSCNAANQSLQWNSVTNKFACTSAGNDTAIFIDTTPAAMTDTNTTQLFDDATKPNIITESATATVLVSVLVHDAAAAGTDSEYDAISIARTTTGVDPVCGTSANIGTIVGFTTDVAPWSAMGTFLDTPGVAGTIKYTVCTNTESVGAPVNNTVDNIKVTLVQVGN